VCACITKLLLYVFDFSVTVYLKSFGINGMGITFSQKENDAETDERLCLRLRFDIASKFTSIYSLYQISPIVSVQELDSFNNLACRRANIDITQSQKSAIL